MSLKEILDLMESVASDPEMSTDDKLSLLEDVNDRMWQLWGAAIEEDARVRKATLTVEKDNG